MRNRVLILTFGRATATQAGTDTVEVTLRRQAATAPPVCVTVANKAVGAVRKFEALARPLQLGHLPAPGHSIFVVAIVRIDFATSPLVGVPVVYVPPIDGTVFFLVAGALE